MTLFARIFRLVWGGDVDRALRPVLAVGLTGSIAGSALFPFLGIWAIKELHASQSALATAFLVGAVLSGGIGYVGGHVSDHIGRRPLILVGWGFQALVPLGLLLVGSNKLAGLTLLALLPAFGALGGAADQAMVADLVAPERQEAAYASVRVAQNLGVTIGPPLGGLFLIGGNWNHLFLGVFPLGLHAASIAYRDNPFLLFMLSAVFATMTYDATDTLLPISATTTHNLAPAEWGVLMVVNPLLVTVFQLRVTRWTARIPSSVKLGVAMPMMGVPFLLLNVNGSAPVIALVIFIFVIGEMLWVPTSQAVVAALAPPDIRGAYMGAYGSTWSVGWALTPFLGLQVRSAYGDATMWMCVAAVGVVAGVLGLVAARGHDHDVAA